MLVYQVNCGGVVVLFCFSRSVAIVQRVRGVDQNLGNTNSQTALPCTRSKSNPPQSHQKSDQPPFQACGFSKFRATRPPQAKPCPNFPQTLRLARSRAKAAKAATRRLGRPGAPAELQRHRGVQLRLHGARDADLAAQPSRRSEAAEAAEAERRRPGSLWLGSFGENPSGGCFSKLPPRGDFEKAMDETRKTRVA